MISILKKNMTKQHFNGKISHQSALFKDDWQF